MFLEIGTDADRVHFLVRSVPTYSPTKSTRTVKSIIDREIFQRIPPVNAKPWGGAFWSSGFFINSVERHGSAGVFRLYAKEQAEKASARRYTPANMPVLNHYLRRHLRGACDTSQFAATVIRRAILLIDLTHLLKSDVTQVSAYCLFRSITEWLSFLGD